MRKNNKKLICGAKAKQRNHEPCKKSPMKNGRCRYHGGLSTGPKSTEGRRKCARANYKHGFYTKAAIADRKKVRMMLKWRDDLDAESMDNDQAFMRMTE